RELDLGPGARRRVDDGTAAVARHAPDDRLAHAAAVVGQRGRVEAGPAIAHVHLQLAVARLGVDVDRRPAAELRRVDHRLPHGRDERLAARVELEVADDDDLDRYAVRALDLAGQRFERGGEPAVAALAPGQPGAQLALLRAGKRGDRARVVGALL